MTAPFIPPPIDSGMAPLPVASLPSIPGLTQSEPVVEANTAPIVPGQPRPVAPAEEIGVAPAKALDPVAGGPGLFEKAREIGMPYITKIQETTKPYVDAAEHKAEELFQKLDQRLEGQTASSTTTPSGVAPSETVSPTGTVGGIKSAPYAAGPGTGSASEGVSVGAGAGELGGKAKHLFEQGFATVSGAFNQITSTLDEKTKTDTHPGIVTQATTAFQTGVHKVDDFLNDKTSPSTASTTTAQGPILTTTNTVPHLDTQGQGEVTKPL